ncbi:hypothetical protein M514_12178 [Trichuris suis]|uniref:Uncharacterized protein n=1 Tax=Trichuris suis TaxID=68888 RepID=A0A085LPN6_9BILA|nr:hypothetical protein M513_12178 [Trichuris suis]KFD62234.1 hypothetical protein M514_12178 [Trichuris suis]
MYPIPATHDVPCWLAAIMAHSFYLDYPKAFRKSNCFVSSTVSNQRKHQEKEPVTEDKSKFWMFSSKYGGAEDGLIANPTICDKSKEKNFTDKRATNQYL